MAAVAILFVVAGLPSISLPSSQKKGWQFAVSPMPRHAPGSAARLEVPMTRPRLLTRTSSTPDTSQSSQVNHSAVLAPEERICRRKPRNRIWGGIDVRDSCHLTAIVQTESLRIGAPQCAQIPYLPVLPEEPSGLGSIREPSSGNRAKRKDQEWC
jgi:hypothetical protein